MKHSIVIYKGPNGEAVRLTNFRTIREAQREATRGDTGEKVIGCIMLNENYPGIQALIALMNMENEIHDLDDTPLENLLQQIFQAGKGK